MNRRIRRGFATERRRIEKRLNDANRVNTSGPVLDGCNVRYEVAERVKAIACGGIGAIHRLVQKLGLPARINESVKLLKIHHPYHESDHVLSVAYNMLCGGRVLEDIEHRRNDRVFLDALGANSIPDPTTAGDFCRRFEAEHVDALMDAINDTRVQIWRKQSRSFLSETARIDADGTLVGTTGECKEGMDIAYNGVWGYHPLVVSFANTREPLYIVNRPGNCVSAEGVVPLFDRSIALCRDGGFKDILLRGDTDFSRTSGEFDRWTDDGVRFIFGYKAWKGLVQTADEQPDALYHELVRRTERAVKTRTRARPENIKKKIVRQRGYKNIKLNAEDIVEFDYKPGKCGRTYRMVVLRKNLSTERGEKVLFDEIRYFFYITNDRCLSAAQVVRESNQRCNQENLIEQHKNGVRALHAPVNTLNANWAYMVMASLAWSIKAWVAVSLPVTPRWRARHLEERNQILRMEFPTFLAAFINIPAQIVKTGRRIVFRFLAWSPWLLIFLRFLEAT
jgi:hypothetical protein